MSQRLWILTQRVDLCTYHNAAPHATGNEPPFASVSLVTCLHCFRCHFRCWGSRYDEAIKRSSEALQPAWSQVQNFRDFRVNDRVEYCHVTYKKSGAVKKRSWYKARVVAIDEAKKKVQYTEPTHPKPLGQAHVRQAVCR